jgi:stearoyl-CoA desaturase (delta-9 desaturase)
MIASRVDTGAVSLGWLTGIGGYRPKSPYRPVGRTLTSGYTADVLKILLVGGLAGFAIMIVANVCTTVFLHRAAAHRALTMRPPIVFVFRLLIWLMTGIRPRQWVAVHRKHHAFTDIEGDPHSPVQFANVALYRREASNPDTVARYARDMPPDRLDRWFFDRAFVGLGVGVVILILTFGVWTGLVAAFVHANLYLATSSAVNAIGHHFGRRPYENNAGNIQWLAFLTAGEGLHNNHHALPSSARLSHRRWEFDPGWWVISTLKRLGLAKVRLSEAVVRAKAGRRPARSAV